MSSTQRNIDTDQPYRWIPDNPDSLVAYDTEFEDVNELTTGEGEDEQHEHPHGDDDREVEPTGIFKQKIQRAAEICSSCFRWNYDIVYPHTLGTSGPDGTVRYFIPTEDTTKPLSSAGRECRNPPRACNCGRVGTLRNRPLPKLDALEAAGHLSHTLTRLGIEHNPLLLLATVTLRKSTPSFATQDDRNFDLATARSLPNYRYSFADYLSPDITDPALPAPDDST